jgi:hypothetical protein
LCVESILPLKKPLTNASCGDAKGHVIAQPTPRSKVQMASYDLGRIRELKAKVRRLDAERAGLEQQIQAKLEVKLQAVVTRRGTARFDRRRVALGHQIDLLSQARDSSRSECERLQASNQQRRAVLDDAQHRLHDKGTAQVVDQVLEPVMRVTLWNYSVQTRRLGKLRVGHIQQLCDRFGLSETDDGTLKIVNVLLNPSRLHDARLGGSEKAPPDDGMGVEELSTGLGYVVHLVHCVCELLRLVPPYAMRFQGSTSRIYGLGAVPEEPLPAPDRLGRLSYLLEAKKSNKGFATGLHLLECNVCWLCALAGQPRRGSDHRQRQRRKEEQLLENLRQLVRAPCLGIDGPLRIRPSSASVSQQLDLAGGLLGPGLSDAATSPDAGNSGEDGSAMRTSYGGGSDVSFTSMDYDRLDVGQLESIFDLEPEFWPEPQPEPESLEHKDSGGITPLRLESSFPLPRSADGMGGPIMSNVSFPMDSPSNRMAYVQNSLAVGSLVATHSPPRHSPPRAATMTAKEAEEAEIQAEIERFDAEEVEEAAPDNRLLTLNVEPDPSFCPDGTVLQIRASAKPELEAKVAVKLGLRTVVLEVFDTDFEEWCLPTTLESFGEIDQVAQIRVASATK